MCRWFASVSRALAAVVNIAVAISPADKIFNIVINLLHSNATNVLPYEGGADRCSGGECKTCSQALNEL